MKLDPCDGGCWFCHTDSPAEMHFSVEFDANFHMDCLKNDLKAGEDPNWGVNAETIIIAREHGLLTSDQVRDMR